MGIAERWLIKSANWTKNLKKTTWFQLQNSTVCVDESFIDYTQAPIKSRFHRNSITQGPLGICNNCRELMWFYLVWICHLCYVQTKNSITYHRSLTCCSDLVLKSVLSDSITRGQRKTAVYPPKPTNDEPPVNSSKLHARALWTRQRQQQMFVNTLQSIWSKHLTSKSNIMILRADARGKTF